MTVTCAECAADLDITDARGPDGGGDFHCADTDACDARFLEMSWGSVHWGDDDGI